MLSRFILHIEIIGPHHLSVCLCAAIRALHPDNKKLTAEAERIHKETTFIAKKRNEIAHEEWLIGPEVVIVFNKNELPQRTGIKRKVAKDGERIEELPSLDEFVELIARTSKLANDVGILCRSVTMIEFDKLQNNQK